MIFAPFKSLADLANRSDAVLVVRIDRHVDVTKRPNLFTTHGCYVYATLKGNVPVGKETTLALQDLGDWIESPFALDSARVVFLVKSAIEGAAFQSLHSQGATIPVSPGFREQVIRGKSTRDAVVALIKQYREYRAKKIEREDALLSAMIANGD